MRWLERMNDAIEYMERNLDGEIDYNEAARICCCSLSKFKSLFQFITDTPLSEYVRQRRMSLSAKEMISGDIRVI